MAEKSQIITEVIKNPGFRQRVRAIAGKKALAVLQEATPDAGELAWAKLVVVDGYDAWVEALLILENTQPETTAAAYNATDSTYDSQLDNILAEVITAKGL
jgi:hypothetical protein